MNRLRLAHICAAGSLMVLISVCIGWELWWAPLRPGGSLLVLKALPLLLPLFGILRGRRYTFQWSAMFILVYLMEGLVRVTSEHGTSQILAAAETLLVLMFLVGCVGYLRQSSGRQSVTTAD